MKLRLGLIGCGRVVERFHLPALTSGDDWRIAAAADPSPERRKWVQTAAADVDIFENAAQMLQAGGLNALLVAVPPLQQTDMGHLAIEHGLPVLLEKPGAVSLDSARELRDHAAHRSVHVQIGLNRRFMRNYQQLRVLVRAEGDRALREGWFRMRVDPVQWGSVTGAVGNVGEFGGVLYDLVSHQVDLLRYVIGDEIDQFERMPVAPDQEERSSLSYRVRFADGGSLACRAAHAPSYEEHLHLRWERGAAYLYPTGILTGRAAEFDAAEWMVRARHWLDRKLIRLGLKPDLMTESFARQWNAFAGLVAGDQWTEDAAGLDDLVELHRLLEELSG